MGNHDMQSKSIAEEIPRDERIIERAKEVGIKLISLEDHAKG